MNILEIRINCPSEESADTIGTLLLENRLAACINRPPPVRSRYHWNGKIENTVEYPLVLRTRASLFDAVDEEVRALHPFETPCIIAISLDRVSPGYAAWIHEVTQQRQPGNC